MLNLPTFDILDESDEQLSCKHQQVYAWGNPEALAALHERMDVIQAVLNVLQCNDAVRQLLADGSIANVHRHSNRYGSMPEVRLLQGKCPDRVAVSKDCHLLVALWRLC